LAVALFGSGNWLGAVVVGRMRMGSVDLVGIFAVGGKEATEANDGGEQNLQQ
jgi:hypothetical protein